MSLSVEDVWLLIYRGARSFGTSEPEDAAQEVITRFLERGEALDTPRILHPRAFWYIAGKREATNQWNRLKRFCGQGRESQASVVSLDEGSAYHSGGNCTSAESTALVNMELETIPPEIIALVQQTHLSTNDRTKLHRWRKRQGVTHTKAPPPPEGALCPHCREPYQERGGIARGKFGDACLKCYQRLESRRRRAALKFSRGIINREVNVQP